MPDRRLSQVAPGGLSPSRSLAKPSGLLGWLVGAIVALVACSPVSAGLVFHSGVDIAASGGGDFAALRHRNFANSNGANGTVYVGVQRNLGGGPRGNNQSVPWTSQIYDFAYTYDPVQKMTATTWTGRTSGTSTVSYQSLASIPTLVANEMTILARNTGPGDLILTLSKINSVGRGGVLSGTLGGTVVTGGTELFTGASWNGAGNAFRQAFLADATLFNNGFQLFGSVTVGAPTTNSNYGNNEASKFEIGLANTTLVPVPEPSTFAMAFAGLAFAGWQVYRRRRAV